MIAKSYKLKFDREAAMSCCFSEMAMSSHMTAVFLFLQQVFPKEVVQPHVLSHYFCFHLCFSRFSFSHSPMDKSLNYAKRCKIFTRCWWIMKWIMEIAEKVPDLLLTIIHLVRWQKFPTNICYPLIRTRNGEMIVFRKFCERTK